MASLTLTPDEALLLGEIEADPVFFVREILGHNPWDVPRRVLRALNQPRARVAVKACHASGKTYTAAEAVLWWLCTGGSAVTTAPTWTQVKRLLWGELHKAYASARLPLGGTLNQTELRLAPDVYAMGLSTNEGVRFQGWHGRILIVLDEAPGVRPDVWEAIEGIRAGGDVRVLALGNPTAAGGAFYAAFTTERRNWQPFTISAFDSPNLSGLTLEALLALPAAELDYAPRPYLVTRRWVREKYGDWGEDSPLWQARVLGEFPKSDEHAVIPLAWVEAANARWLAWREAGAVLPAFTGVGADIGGGGDKTVLASRHGAIIPALHRFNDRDSMVLTGHIAMMLQSFGGYAYVDEIGIGAGVGARLREQGFTTYAFIAGAASPFTDASGELGFANRRAEAWWNLRTLLDPQYSNPIALPPDDTLTADLTAPRWKPTSQGRILVESKDEIRKRLGRSTDDGDAVVMVFAALPPDQAGGLMVYDAPVAISPF